MLSEQMKVSLSTPESYLDLRQKQIIERWRLQVIQLEGVENKAQQVVDRAHGGEFDKFSGYDDYVIPYQLIDELADALLAGE